MPAAVAPEIYDGYRRQVHQVTLPHIHLAGMAADRLDETGGGRIRREPFGQHAPVRIRMGHRRIDAVAVTEGRRVDVIDMGRVAQIVAQQQVIGLDIQRVAVSDAPAVLVILRQVVDIVRVGPRRVAHPDPHQPHVFMDRIGAEIRRVGRRILGRRMDAGALSVEGQPVIAALQVVAAHAALGQRQEPVGADILRRPRRAVFAPPQNHVLAKDRFSQRARRQIVRPACDVPGVSNECHSAALSHRATIIVCVHTIMRARFVAVNKCTRLELRQMCRKITQIV